MQTTTYATLKLARALGCNRTAGNAGIPVQAVRDAVAAAAVDLGRITFDPDALAVVAAERLYKYDALSANDYAICESILWTLRD